MFSDLHCLKVFGAQYVVIHMTENQSLYLEEAEGRAAQSRPLLFVRICVTAV